VRGFGEGDLGKGQIKEGGRPRMGKSFTHDSGISPGLSVQLIVIV